MSLGPREDYERLEASRVLAPVDERPSGRSSASWCPGRPAAEGVARRLLDAAIDYARGPRRDPAGGLSGRHRRASGSRPRTPIAARCGCSRRPGSRRSPVVARTPQSPERPIVRRESRPADLRHPSRPATVVRRVDTALARRLDCRPACRSPALVQLIRRGPPNDDATDPPAHDGAYRRRREREICAHLELAAGGRTAFRTEPRAVGQIGPPAFLMPFPALQADQRDTTSREAHPTTVGGEARGSSLSEPLHHAPAWSPP